MLKLKYDFIFITSCCDVSEIYNLIDSINRNNSELIVLLIITNMSGEFLTINKNISFDFKVINVSCLLNSSESRNKGIDYVLKNNIQSNYIAFPDDDSTYDEIFFLYFKRLFNSPIRYYKNYICNVRCRDNINLFYRKKIANNPFMVTKYNFDNIGAVNFILNYDTFYNIKYFNVKYGVGSIYGAGEDGDYFLRALNYTEIYYSPDFYTIHPASNIVNRNLNYTELNNRMTKYSRGVISVLCLHRMYLYAFYISFRAFGGFIFNLMSNFKISFLYLKIFILRLYFLFKFSFYV
jgi:hypothetical protein